MVGSFDLLIDGLTDNWICTLSEHFSGGRVTVKFVDSDKTISLSGFTADVREVDEFIQQKYVSKVCHDSFELTLPGL